MLSRSPGALRPSRFPRCELNARSLESPEQATGLLARQAGKNGSIEGLRGLLALLVLAIHIVKMASKVHLVAVPGSLAQFLGPYRACIFFAISGFFSVQTLTRNSDLKRFAGRRLARIYPLFFLLHLVMFIMGPHLNYEWMGQLRADKGSYLVAFVSNLLLLPGLIDLPIAQKNAWTLSYEAAFYLLLGVLFWLPQRLRGMARKITIAVVCLICAAVVCWRPCAVFFLVGVSSFELFRRRKGQKTPRLLGGFTGTASLLLGWLIFPYSIWASSIVAWPFFYSLILRTGFHSEILGKRWIRFLGKISYSVYLLHPFILDPLRRIAASVSRHTGPDWAFLFFLCAGSSLSVLVGFISYELIEKRLTDFLSNMHWRAFALKIATLGRKRVDRDWSVQSPGAYSQREQSQFSNELRRAS